MRVCVGRATAVKLFFFSPVNQTDAADDRQSLGGARQDEQGVTRPPVHVDGTFLLFDSNNPHVWH